MDLLLIRHGHCVGQTPAGSPDDHDCELTEVGHRQAERLAKALADFPGGRPTAVLSSPLLRAVDTALPTARVLGLPVSVRADLREVQPRRGQRGQGRRDLALRYSELRFDDSVGPDGWDHGDATYETMIDRASGFLEILRHDYPGDDRVAVVTHGAFASFVLTQALRIGTNSPVWFILDNTSVSVLRLPQADRPGAGMFPPYRAQVLMVNSTAHLEPDLRTPDPLDW